MSKPEDIKIQAGNQYYGGASITAAVTRINRDENLADELGIFRLASVHRDLDLSHQPPLNAVLVNLRIKFITKADVEVEHVIPVMVTQGDDEEALTCYSGAQVDEKKFFEFYKSVKLVAALDRRSHYHSEPFLAYYLCSDDGKKFLLREFEKKSLIVVGADGEHYESNVKEVTSIGIDLHSTKVVCFNCGPFLKAAVPHLLNALNWTLVLPKGKRLAAMEFNISANQNFDYSNISGVHRKGVFIKNETFDHIPVSESNDENILTNTEKLLGNSRVRLQRVGEASNRTYFVSGSSAVNGDVIALRGLDEKRWQIVATAAAVEIQRMWRRSRDGKKSGAVTADKKITEKAAVKKPVTKASVVAAEDLDIFNYVGESSNLTHQNVLHLIGEAFEIAGANPDQTATAVISEDKSLDYSLRDEILKFIGQEPAQDRISIALCRGHIDEESKQIAGDTHWTGLHLRRVENEDGTISIQAYHMDSMGDIIPSTVARVLASIKETNLEDLDDDLAVNETYKNAIAHLENINFTECQPVKCAQQEDGYSCGYHSVFNLLRIHDADEIDALPKAVTQGGAVVEIDQFIEDRKSDLQTNFNQAVNVQLRQHARFSADMDLNRALSESIFISDESNLDKLQKLIQLEMEIKKLDSDAALTLSALHLEQFYKKLLSNCVEEIRYKFSTMEYEVEEADNLQREQILEKLSNAKTAQNPQDFLEVLGRVFKNPVLLSSESDELLAGIVEIEKGHEDMISLSSGMAEVSLKDDSPSSSPEKMKSKKLSTDQTAKTKRQSK